jgi:hypothetical protein
MRKCLNCSTNIEHKERRVVYCSRSCSATHTQLGKPSNNRKYASADAPAPTCKCGVRIDTFDPRYSMCHACNRKRREEIKHARELEKQKKKQQSLADALKKKVTKKTKHHNRLKCRYTKRERRAYQRLYYLKRRTKLIELRGSKCVDCGSKVNLEFDHRNPSTKVASVSKMILSKSFKETVAEARKCDLRCSKCHSMRTQRLRHNTLCKRSHERPRYYSKLSKEDVRKIKRLLGKGNTHSEIGLKFSVSRSTITAIACGKTWTDV